MNFVINVFESCKTLIVRFFRIFAPKAIVTKRLKGTNKYLSYDRLQHLLFLGCPTISYEPLIQRTISQCIKKGDIVFDIGANIGQYTLLFSTYVSSHGKVVAIEPDPLNFAFLGLNVANNILENVILLNKGVTSVCEVKDYYRDSITGGRMGSFDLKFVGDNFRGEKKKVQTTTISNLIFHSGIPNFIKIDVEGFEAQVLEGIEQPLLATTFLIEVRKETRDFVFNYFNLKSFSCYLFANDQVNAITSSTLIPDFANLLFLPKAKVNALTVFPIEKLF